MQFSRDSHKLPQYTETNNSISTLVIRHCIQKLHLLSHILETKSTYFHTPFAQGKKLTSTQYFRLLQKMITANHESIITHCGNIISLFPHIPHIVEAVNFYSEPCGNPMNQFLHKKCMISAQIFPQSINIFLNRQSPWLRVFPCLVIYKPLQSHFNLLRAPENFILANHFGLQ